MSRGAEKPYELRLLLAERRSVGAGTGLSPVQCAVVDDRRQDGSAGTRIGGGGLSDDAVRDGHRGHVEVSQIRRNSRDVVGTGIATGGHAQAVDTFCNYQLVAGNDGHHFREARLAYVVVVGRNGDGGQDGDDRHDDHQFDEGEALHVLLHGISPRAVGW